MKSYKGSCLCKQVKFELTGEISSIIHCHCSKCRKSSGTAYATNGFINRSDLTITEGKQLISFYEMSPGKKRHFCQVCASPLYSSNASDTNRLRLRLGALDTAISERPISHNFVSSKADWDTVESSLPCYDAHEPSR
ncbi:GFA family protein [Flocculibacter collagenilyticus]|uniref:GFA family protein n=1 Tax=Flocculibacter collagenilyticus TaxID=2744479 RepID=UPI0018F368BA|nr:GFA family protein [Flocculibacter collagenilyticus]